MKHQRCRIQPARQRGCTPLQPASLPASALRAAHLPASVGVTLLMSAAASLVPATAAYSLSAIACQTVGFLVRSCCLAVFATVLLQTSLWCHRSRMHPHPLQQHGALSISAPVPRPCIAGAAAALHAPGGRWPRHLHAVHAVVALAAQRECCCACCVFSLCVPAWALSVLVSLYVHRTQASNQPTNCPPLSLNMQAAQALYLATSAGAAAWSPLLAYPFLDMAHISMSQHGPLLMGVSGVLTRATSVAAVWAMLRNGHGATDTAGFEAAGVVSFGCQGRWRLRGAVRLCVMQSCWRWPPECAM